MRGQINKPLINNFHYGWGNIQMLINGVPITGITSINYGEEQTTEKVFGAGRTVIGYGLGNYEANASITLLDNELQAIQNASKDGNIINLDPFNIIVSYIPSEGQGTPKVDIIHNVKFMKNERSISQGDSKIEVQLDLICSHITFG